MISHVTIGSNDIPASRAFYDALLATLGLQQVAAYKVSTAYARSRETAPWIWVVRSYDRKPASVGNGCHVAFAADSDETVRRFHATALAKGGSDEGAPGLRDRYDADYYCAYVRCPEGNKLQAVHYGEGRGWVPGQEALSHVTLGTNDLARSSAFYDKLASVLGLERLYATDNATAYCKPGTQKPAVTTRKPFDGKPATVGNGFHVAFLADDRASVRAFHETALAEGGADEGAPGPRPLYGDRYYGAYVRDLDGNKLQAVCYRPE